MALIDFGGIKEEVVTRKEFPMAKARKVLKGETIAVIGYGVQGPAQALNMKDNGFKVIIGQSKKYHEGLGPGQEGWLGARQRPVRNRRSLRTGHDHRNACFRCGAKSHLADCQETAQTRQCPVLFARILDCLQRPDQSHSAEGCRRDHGRAQRFRHFLAPQFPFRRRHQLQLCGRTGRHRPRPRAMHGAWHRHRFRIPVSHHLQE